VRRPIEITFRQQQIERTLLDWLRVECAVKEEGRRMKEECRRQRRCGTNAPTPSPPPAPAAETLALERTLSDLVNQAYALTPTEIALMWQTAPPRMPMPWPAT
jgi:hypothetical protein